MVKIKYYVKAGFTLIELLIVIAILGILAAAVMIAINPNKRMQEARDAARLADTSQISESIAEYYVTHGTYPPDPAISTETEFASDEGPNWIPGLDNLPQDPNQAGIISTLASLFNIKGNNQTTQNSAIKPQVAGLHSVTIEAEQTGGSISYLESKEPLGIYPPDYSDFCTSGTAGGVWVGEYFTSAGNYYNAQRHYLEFDTSTIPPNAAINSVKLELKTLQNNAQGSYTLNARYFDWGSSLECPPSGSTTGGDWGSNPPTSTLAGNILKSGIPPNGIFNIEFTDSSGININGLTKLMLTSKEEEDNIRPTGNNHILYYSQYSAVSKPKLVIDYQTPSFSPPPESPPPSPPPKGCKNKKKIYCYLVPLDRKSAVLWAVLENEDDERIYSKETAKCKETPPAETFLNYCINNP